MGVSEIISISVSVITLITTIIIFTIQFRQDKRVNIQLEDRRKRDLETKIKSFIIQHNDELEYIPLCFIASKYDNHKKYKRTIYNEYNFLSNEEQQELLNQLKYNFKEITDTNWVDTSLNKVKSFIKKNNFGDDFLYDDSKYFKRSLNYGSLEYDESRESGDYLCEDVFDWTNMNFRNNIPYVNNLTMYEYFIEYYKRVSLEQDKLALVNPNVIPPMNLLIDVQDLRNCSEENVCYWMMNAVQAILIIMLRNLNYRNYEYISCGDALMETYEDKYLSVLVNMYNLIQLEETSVTKEK